MNTSHFTGFRMGVAIFNDSSGSPFHEIMNLVGWKRSEGCQFSLVLEGWEKDREEGLISRRAVAVIGFLYNGVWFGNLGKARLIPYTLL